MGFLNVLLVIVLVLSGIATVLLVLMHSGKGTGLSEMISASVICILALTFPVGTIG